MASHNLPSRDEYIANNVTVIDTCNICLEPFNAQHIPARLSGMNSCHHVFGSSCLKTWLTTANENANKCPTCRNVLYYVPGEDSGDSEDDQDDTAQQDPGYDVNSATSLLPQQLNQQQAWYRGAWMHLMCIDNLNTAYGLVRYLVDRLAEPGMYNEDRIKACVVSALNDVAHYHCVSICIQEDDWEDMIGAVKVLFGEWRASGRPSYYRCLQIISWEVQWQFCDGHFDYGPNPLVPAHDPHGPIIVGPSIDWSPMSIENIRSFKVAENLMRCITNSFKPSDNYSHHQMKMRVLVAITDVERLHNVIIATPALESWIWPSVLRMVSKMLILWRMLGIPPSILWGVHCLANCFGWKLDGENSRLALQGHAMLGMSFLNGKLEATATRMISRLYSIYDTSPIGILPFDSSRHSSSF